MIDNKQNVMAGIVVSLYLRFGRSANMYTKLDAYPINSISNAEGCFAFL